MIDSRDENTTDGRKLTLRGDLTVENSEKLKSLLINAVHDTERLFLDLKGVRATDTAGLQLLCATHKTSLRLGKEVTVLGRLPDAIEEAMRDAGYNRMEGCSPKAKDRCLWIGGPHE